jgi:hypothetical protein
MTLDEVKEKYLVVTSPIIGADTAERLLDKVMKLEAVEDVSSLFDGQA